MKKKLTLDDFNFMEVDNGQHYYIEYRCPVSGITWVNRTHGTSILERHNLIDLTKNREKPTQKALYELKKFCMKGIRNAFIINPKLFDHENN